MTAWDPPFPRAAYTHADRHADTAQPVHATCFDMLQTRLRGLLYPCTVSSSHLQHSQFTKHATCHATNTPMHVWLTIPVSHSRALLTAHTHTHTQCTRTHTARSCAMLCFAMLCYISNAPRSRIDKTHQDGFNPLADVMAQSAVCQSLACAAECVRHLQFAQHARNERRQVCMCLHVPECALQSACQTDLRLVVGKCSDLGS